MFILRQSTAVDVLIGPFVDGTDGATTEEALSPSVQLSKNGQTAATKNDATTPAHDNAGYYNCEFDATDTNTVGTLVAFVEGSTATHLQVRHEFQVIEEAAYDAMFAASAAGPLQPTVAGRTLDVSAAGEAGLDWANIGGPTTSQTLSGTTIGTTTANTDMRGTDNAALAAVLGALADAAAAGDPTSADTVMQYIKQLINTLEGTVGIPSFPAEAAPANNVSLAEVIRAIAVDVTGLAGAAMRGTDSAFLAASAPTNFSALVITAGGAVDSLLQGFLNTLIVESTAGRIAANWDNLFDNADAASALTLDLIALEATIAALNDISTADVLTQVNAALDTAIAELAQAQPSATPTIRTALMLLYMALAQRLDLTTSGAPDILGLYNSSGTLIAKKTVTDDGSDYSEARMVTGP